MIPLAEPRPTCIYRRFTLHTAGRRCHRRREKHDSGSHGVDKCYPSIFHAAIGLVSRMCGGWRLPDVPDSFIPLIGDIVPAARSLAINILSFLGRLSILPAMSRGRCFHILLIHRHRVLYGRLGVVPAL